MLAIIASQKNFIELPHAAAATHPSNEMLLTHCASCAAHLGLSSGKKCGRCSTRYCGPECQKKHWEEGGHDTLCKKIKKAGGAEQYNANKKYAEGVAVAAEACAADTKGQTCYICTQALHWKTKEGLVRMCACRGTAGFAHVSCLAEQAKILVEEGQENNLDDKAMQSRWERWHTCGLCEQDYHGAVKCALGWACWKTYVGRPETDHPRQMAMSVLGSGLFEQGHHRDSLTVQEVVLSMMRRLGAPEDNVLSGQANLAMAYGKLRQYEGALQIELDVYSGRLQLHGEENEYTVRAANNYASTLSTLRRFEEVKPLLRRTMPVARRVLGDSDVITYKIQSLYANALKEDPAATLDDLHEAMNTLEETERTARRVLGGAHPLVVSIERDLRVSRAALGVHETATDFLKNIVAPRP
jgi:hypothetical protein